MAASPVNRWLIPVGAVAVHICIGSVYAWSTFNRPFQALLPKAPGWFSPPYITPIRPPLSYFEVKVPHSAAHGSNGVDRGRLQQLACIAIRMRLADRRHRTPHSASRSWCSWAWASSEEWAADSAILHP